MRRCLLVLVLAVALLGLLAAPALAATTAPTSYPSTNIPIILPAFGDGVWAVNTGLTGHPSQDVTLYQSAQRGKDFKPIPVNTPVLGCMGWLGAIFGQVQNVPYQVATTIDVSGPAGFSQHFGPAATAPYWTGATAWDQWWTEWIGGPPPELVNPACQAGVYWNHLYLPIGPFPTAGWYQFHTSQVQVLPVTDLIPWLEDQTGPLHETPDMIDWATDFNFYVGK